MAMEESPTVLEQISADAHKQYSKAERTQKSYKFYIHQGRAWLSNSRTDGQEMGSEDDTGEKVVDSFDVGLWRNTFDGPLNKYSASALELFLTTRCLQEGCSHSTAQVIHTAFADYWDNM